MSAPRQPVFAPWGKFGAVAALVVAGAAVALVVIPPVRDAMMKGKISSVLSNMRQLQIAAQTMAADGVSSGDKRLGWPGNMGGSFSRWTGELLRGGYLSEKDLRKYLSVPGYELKEVPTANDAAVLVYAVKADSAPTAVFLSTANFRNTPEGGVLDPKSKPFRNVIFGVMRHGGAGLILFPKHVGQTKTIGSYVPLCH